MNPYISDPAHSTSAAVWPRLVGFIVAVVALNLALGFHNIWPTPLVRLSRELSVEVAALVLILSLYISWRGGIGRAWRAALSGLLLIMIIGRYAEVVAPALFGRSINLYWDLRHAPHVAEMVLAVAPPWQVVAAILGLIGLFAVIIFSLWQIFRLMARGLEVPMIRRGAMAAAVAVIAVYGAGMASRDLTAERWFAIPVSVTYAKQGEFLLEITATQDVDARFAEPPLAPSDLGRLEGGDAYIMFFESYGAIVFDAPALAAALDPTFSALEAGLAAQGWHAASALVEAPTYGGASWLSHASLLAGITVARHHEYEMLLTSNRRTLVGRFQDAGYRAWALMPGLKQRWPEGDFYGFDRLIGADALDYTGPAYGWWEVPDQYSLDWLHRHALTDNGDPRPALVFFTSITSHMPFTPRPPYIADWSDLAGSFNALPAPIEDDSWTDLTAAYGQAIAYDLQVLQGLLENWAPSDAIVLVFGDHQPPAVVGGPDLPWLAPVHIISKRDDLVAAFVADGFRPGIRPQGSIFGRIADVNTVILKRLDSNNNRLRADRQLGIE